MTAKRLGLLGMAHGHAHMYAAAWARHPELGVVIDTAWDHDADRLASVAGRFGFSPSASVGELLRNPKLDAVLIAAETALHADLVEQAAAAGKPVILQKPLALTRAEADRMVTAVDRTGIPFTLAWQMRVDPQNLAIRELLAAEAIGRLFLVRRRHSLNFNLDPKAAESWHTQPRWNRDLWADDAAHPFDFIYWLFGMPDTVTAELRTLHNPAAGLDNGIAILSYPDGPLVEIACSFTNHAAENTVEMAGAKGTLIQNFGDGPSCAAPRPDNVPGLKWYTADTRQWTVSPIPSPRSQAERIAGLAGPLADWLHGRRPALATAAEGRDVLRLILATYISTREGRRVALDDPAIDRL